MAKTLIACATILTASASAGMALAQPAAAETLQAPAAEAVPAAGEGAATDAAVAESGSPVGDAPPASPAAAAPMEETPPAAEPAPEADGQTQASGSFAVGAGSSAPPAAGAEAEADAGGGGYLERYKPEAGMWELGLFMGVLFPSKDHRLLAPQYEHRAYGPIALVGGGRVGFYPLSFAGIEGEAAMMPTKVEDGPSAMLATTRFHVVAQLPTMSVVPFLLGGGGTLHAFSRSMGADGDPLIHFGAGVKVPFGELVSARLDLRDNLTQKNDAAQGAQTHHPEVLLGVTVSLGRTRHEPKPPPPPPDRDGDRLPDAEDQCPDVVGLVPTGCPADTDNDGVADPSDECPREPGPAPTGCPDRDPDGDGIPLPCDRCPDEKGVAPDGCPVRDTDGDGLLDDVDKCPNEAETKNGYQDQDGCPDEVPEAVKKFTGVIEGIYFAKAKATIRPQSTNTLNAAVKVLKEYPDIEIEIVGHTSSEGDQAVNEKLSQDRADAVKQYLVDQGVAESRIRTRGAGSTEPIADNKTEAGRKKNRRIEFKLGGR